MTLHVRLTHPTGATLIVQRATHVEVAEEFMFFLDIDGATVLILRVKDVERVHDPTNVEDHQ